MSNHITVTVGRTKYNIIADDPAEYVTELAEYFDNQFTELSKSSRIPALTAAVLAGITVTDEFFKSRNSVDSLVNQIKEYVSETTRMRSEIGELRRELERTKVELERYRGKA